MIKKETLLILFLFSISLSSYGQLAGTYTIGQNTNLNYDFNTISAAIDSLEQVGVSAPVIMKIDSGIYNEQVEIHTINNTSSTNTLTFESLSGDSSDVILTYNLQNNAGDVLLIDSTNYLIIKSITIKADGVGVSGSGISTVVRITHSSNRIQLLNNVIIGGQIGTSNFYGIYNQASRLQVKNSLIQNCDVGILFYNQNTPLYPKATISNNQIINFKSTGLNISGGDNRITNNRIETCIDSIYNTGIVDLGHSTISSNIILNPSCGIFILDNMSSRIINNFISIDRINSTNTGIILSYMSGANINFNTINIISGTNKSYCINRTDGGALIINNILNNSVGPVFYLSKASYLNSIDYNITHTDFPVFTRVGSGQSITNYYSLASLQTANKFTNCIDSKAHFNSKSDLHLSFNQFASSGIFNSNPNTYPYISVDEYHDIDNQARDTNNIRPGADEYFPQAIDILPVEFLSPKSNYIFPFSDTIKVIVMNAGLTTVYSYQLKLDIMGHPPTYLQVNDSLLPNQTDTISFNNLVYPQNSFNISLKTILATDLNPINDSISKYIISQITDVGIIEIISPHDSLNPNLSNTPVRVVIKNYGNTTIDSIPIFYKTPSVTVYDTSYSPIGCGDKLVFEFSQSMVLPTIDSLICVATNLALDTIYSNDSLCNTLYYPSLSLRNSEKDNLRINVFPNPTNKAVYFIFEGPVPNNIRIEIFNTLGQRIKTQEYPQDIQNMGIKINIRSLSPGIYFYHVLINNKIKFGGKIIKT